MKRRRIGLQYRVTITVMMGVPGPGGSSPRRFSRRLKGVAAAAIIALAVVVYTLFGSVPGTSGSPSVLPIGTPLSAQTCSQLESASTLNSSLAAFYNGFSLQNYSAGPNGTPALPISAYPSLTVGESALYSAWTSICESGQFGYAYGQANGSSGFFSGAELAANGHYDFFYGFIWQDQCPMSGVGSADPCQATATWTVDLVTDTVLGPTFTNEKQVPLGAP